MRNIFEGTKVIITGHTGFKGSWLSIWLDSLGAKVTGISLDPSSVPSHFTATNLASKMQDLRVDIRNRNSLKRIFQETEPDYVFHLAAQPLVRRSYADPAETFETNVLGTMNILEGLRGLKNSCVAIFITSDKCYKNVEWIWGYRETDELGGPDPYSASKAGAEITISSYVKSFFPAGSPVKIGIGRAGNVIGGGDWAVDRIVPDCVRAWAEDRPVQLRSPHATRPWQHVLEPLSGYLSLAIKLSKDSALHGEPFNFGPAADQNQSVLDLVKEMSLHWNKVRWEDLSKGAKGPYESGLLKLNCDKALHFLKWKPVMNFAETVSFTAEWYKKFYAPENKNNILELSLRQIEKYTEMAKLKRISWSNDT